MALSWGPGQTNHAQAAFRLSQTWNTLEAHLETRDYDSTDHAEGDLLYRRWFSQFFNVIAGATYFPGFETDKTRGVLGVGYTLPMLIETNLFVDHKGKARLDLEKRFQWTKHVLTDAEISFRDGLPAEWEVTLMYAKNWIWAAGFMLTEDKAGVGLQYRF